MESQNQLQLDKSRVTLLLEINAELLRETVNLQSNGKSLPSQSDEKPDKGFYEYATTSYRRHLRVAMFLQPVES